MRMLVRIVFTLSLFLAVTGAAQAAPSPADLQKCLNDAGKLEHARRILEVMTLQPTPALVPLEGARFIPANAFFASFFQTPVQGPIINDIDELRFIPFTLSGTSLLIVTKEARSWDAEKSRKVLAVARLQNIRISLLWLETQAPQAALDTLVKESGGQVWLLSDLNRLVFQYVCSA
jgi:hypothetical protein